MLEGRETADHWQDGGTKHKPAWAEVPFGAIVITGRCRITTVVGEGTAWLLEASMVEQVGGKQRVSKHYETNLHCVH